MPELDPLLKELQSIGVIPGLMPTTAYAPPSKLVEAIADRKLVVSEPPIEAVVRELLGPVLLSLRSRLLKVSSIHASLGVEIETMRSELAQFESILEELEVSDEL